MLFLGVCNVVTEFEKQGMRRGFSRAPLKFTLVEFTARRRRPMQEQMLFGIR